jgi:hypothetical protein
LRSSPSLPIEPVERDGNAARRRVGEAMHIRTRKAVGCFAFLAYLTIYALLAASLGVALFPILPTWAQLIYYAIAGIVWIFPLKPLFGWMNKAE